LHRKEIRKLIETIKEEKAQVSQEIQKMSEELQRYKMAYKKLVNFNNSCFILIEKRKSSSTKGYQSRGTREQSD